MAANGSGAQPSQNPTKCTASDFVESLSYLHVGGRGTYSSQVMTRLATLAFQRIGN